MSFYIVNQLQKLFNLDSLDQAKMFSSKVNGWETHKNGFWEFFLGCNEIPSLEQLKSIVKNSPPEHVIEIYLEIPKEVFSLTTYETTHYVELNNNQFDLIYKEIEKEMNGKHDFLKVLVSANEYRDDHNYPLFKSKNSIRIELNVPINAKLCHKQELTDIPADLSFVQYF